MAIRFGPAVCGDLQAAERREWLICNGLGSYGSGTVAGCRTRSYHGLLVAALEAPADPCTRTLLVAGLEEIVQPVGEPAAPPAAATPLGSQRWCDGGVEPQGHHTLVAFALEGSVPCWRFAIGDALLEKRVWMQPGAHTTTVHYRLLQSSRPLRLEVGVLVNARCHHGGSAHPPIALIAIERGVRVEPAVHGVPPFHLRCDRGDCSLAAPDDWVCAMALPAERERGLPWADDQLRACRFTLALSEAVADATLVFSTDPQAPLAGEAGLAARHRHDEGLRQQWQRANPGRAARAPDWIRQLVLAADAFLVARGGGVDPGSSVIAGYPWFGDWGRDTMISLSGLTLATGRPAIGARILRTYARHLSGGMLPNRFPEGGAPLGEHDYNTVDATLWFVEAVRRHHAITGDLALLRELWPCLQAIISAHVRGTRHGIGLDPADGLLRAGTEGLQLTWMDAKVNGEVITPRIGKPVEVNALWFCALRSMAGFAALLAGDGEGACSQEADGLAAVTAAAAAPAAVAASGSAAAALRTYAGLAERARCGFQRFWNPATGCCFDVLDGPDGGHEDAVRPNQLLAVALTDQLLSPGQAGRLLQVCNQRLLTPMGLRSLDPADPRYQGRYGGGPLQRDGAYHQGTVWAWWLGPWALAQARVQGTAAPALQWLEAIGDHLADAGVGSVSEIFDGDPPHAPRGCIAQAWSVAELLRAWTELADLTPP